MAGKIGDRRGGRKAVSGGAVRRLFRDGFQRKYKTVQGDELEINHSSTNESLALDLNAHFGPWLQCSARKPFGTELPTGL